MPGMFASLASQPKALNQMLSFSLTKRFASFHLDARLETLSPRLVLFGPSGSGKSLTLQCVAGLLDPDSGFVSMGEHVLFDSAARRHVPPERRCIGYVPQTASLFPHLSVGENVAYGLRRLSVDQRTERVAKLMASVRLHGYEGRRPERLSGGEQQRVSLARALATEPRLLLLDEPFSALDVPVRAVLRQELIELQNRLGFAWVFVTHDLEEAYLLADEIAVYHGGRILQFGPRDDIFYRPESAEVARLVGVQNLLPVKRRGPDRVVIEDSDIALVTELGGRDVPDDQRLWCCIRQEDIRIVRKDRPPYRLDTGTSLRGRLIEERQLGFAVSMKFAVRQDESARPVPGERESRYDEGEPGCSAKSASLSLWVDLPLQAYRSMGMGADHSWELFIPAAAIHLIPR